MTNPPDKTDEETYIKRTVRFPPGIHDEITLAAGRNGRSFNAEVVARCHANSLAAVKQELAVIKAMVQKVLDKD